jgi:hypothetical protein
VGRGAWIAAAGLLAATPASAGVVSAAPDAASVTIYRTREADTLTITDPEEEAQGLALVTETRTLDLPAGRSQVSFQGVAEGLIPQTAKLEGLPSGAVEQNFDYDLLSPRGLLARSVGKSVKLVRTNRVTGEVIEKEALVRSGPDGVILEIDGRIEGLDCAGWAERLVFDEVPAGLTERPTLSLVAEAPAAGRYQVKLSYLARGLDWSADYVARISPDGRTLDLTGWVTLVNKSSADFTRAPVGVVAGRLNRVDPYGDRFDRPEDVDAPRSNCWWSGPTNLPRWDFPLPRPTPVRARDNYSIEATDVSELVVTGSRLDPRQLGDYKLYALNEPTRIAPRQIKQVQLMDQKDVKFERLYFHEVEDSWNIDEADQAARVEVRLVNDKASNLGLPLPAGFVAVMEVDSQGRPILAGDGRITDQAVGLPFQIELGSSPDVRVQTATLAHSTTGRNETWRERITNEVTVFNGKAVPVEFEVRHPYRGRGFRVTAESRRHGVRYGWPFWRYRLKPGERQVLRYSIEQRG